MITINKNDVEGITLLSIEEARELPRWLLANGDRWWLRSPGNYPPYAAIVDNDGSVSSGGNYVSHDNVCVRPVIKVNMKPYLPLIVRGRIQPLMVGETVRVLFKQAQYIGDDMVLLCESIGYHKFDEESNDYEKSEIKDFIEEWLKEKTKKMKIHKITLNEEFADEVLSGQKSFEIRLNDRGYQKGDLVKFKVVDLYGISSVAHPLNDELFEITYVLSGWELKEGYVAFSIKRIDKEEI